MSITDVSNAGDAIADVEAALTHADEQEREQAATAADHEVAQAEVLHGEDPDVIEIEVAGETVECDPIGLGRRARLMRRAQQADERGDDMAQVDVVLDMIDTLIRASRSEEHDQDWWDDLTDTEVRGAFQTLGRRSAGGNE